LKYWDTYLKEKVCGLACTKEKVSTLYDDYNCCLQCDLYYDKYCDGCYRVQKKEITVKEQCPNYIRRLRLILEVL